MQKAIVPGPMAGGVEALKLSPGVISHGHLFVTGMTGVGADGQMPEAAAEQFHNAFDKIELVLAEAGLGWDAVVEMTSYHVGIRDHFDLFTDIRGAYMRAPYPAWTAVGVAELRRPGALVEIKVVAAVAKDG